VKKNHWITLVIGTAIVLGIYAVPGITQPAGQPAAAQIPNLVAIIDVAQVIKQHPDFVAKQTALQEKVRQAEAAFQERQENIGKKQKALDTPQYRSGSPEHQRLLDEIANDLAEFEKDAKTLQRKFGLENSQIMYDTYKDIKATIGNYAMARGIAQVTDYREFEPNPADPQTVAEDMDQRLVWYNKGVNITGAILQNLYAARGLTYQAPTAATAGNAGVANAGPAPRTANAPATPAAPTMTPGAPMQR
jgi:Skp family chaperone for outer membrane proteins